MRYSKKLLLVLLVLTASFAFSDPVQAAFGSQGGAEGEGNVVTDKHARGTRYSGPLTIYFEQNGIIGSVNMYIFLRLEEKRIFMMDFLVMPMMSQRPSKVCKVL